MSLSIPGKTLFQTWRDHDLFSGLSVFLVAIPLCLGLAVASGAPAQAGLLAGIIGGLVVASLSRSALAISGPEAGLVALTAAGIMTLGSFESFLLAVIAAGLIQISLGVFKVGPWIHYVPISVMKGMISG
ncbi:MAG: SulP family inorganic anion transporter, partial [Holophagaceae bacterium]